jgi:hypothetical protein
MRSRLAVVSVLMLALAVIGTAEPANATAAPQEFQRFPIPAAGSVINLDSAPEFYVTLARASVLRITAVEGHSIRLEVRALLTPLPNPAASPIASNDLGRTLASVANAPNSRLGFDPATICENQKLRPAPFPSLDPLPTVDRDLVRDCALLHSSVH